MCIPLPSRKDIRYQLNLAGGAVMDVGCYAIHQARTLAGAEPEVVSARAKCISPGVDRWLQADLQFPDDCTGSFECALWSRRLLSLGARVEGERGTLTVFNLTGPQYFHRVVVRTRDPATGAETKRRERVKGQHTYWYQLNAFVAAVRDGAPYPTNPADAVANMRVMDASYRAAGLEPRQPS
jgi:predicted dehydrogenase